jgi:hypothetical protein
MVNVHIIHTAGKVVGFVDEGYTSEVSSRVQVNFPNSQITTNTVIFNPDTPLNLDTVSVTDNSASILTGSALEAHYEVLLAEAELEDLRNERHRRLAETDWWANSDLTMTEEQTVYRQRLRDITDEFSSVESVEWPTLGQEVWPTPPFQPGT